MNNINKHISEDQLMAYLANEADNTLVKEIEAWLALSDDNVALLSELENVWSESGKLKIKPVVVDVDAAWNKLSGKIDSTETKIIDLNPEKSSGKKLSKIILRIAAVLLITIGVSVILYTMRNPESHSLMSQDIILNKTLSDGSKVNLNKNSKLIYPEEFTGNVREVELEGEAFFEIEPDKEKPFIIHSDMASIKVLGTSFNVKAISSSNEVEVSVKTGTVMLYSITEEANDTVSIVLNAGEKGIYNKDSQQVSRIETASPNELYWLNKTLIFEETELVKVFELLQDYFDITIKVQNENTNYCKLNVTFKDETIDEILEVIAASFNLEVIKKEEKTYTLNGDGC